jgi:predicted nucleic acid-binding protein
MNSSNCSPRCALPRGSPAPKRCDFLQGRDAAAVEIDRYDDPCYSAISWMEVMIGAGSDAEQFAAETLFESMRRIDLSADIARRAVELRRQLRLKLPDAILLATAD